MRISFNWMPLVCLMTLMACQSNDEMESELIATEKIIRKNPIDQLTDDFGRVLASSFRNEEIRHLIKSEVMKQFAGDYDVLLASIIDQPLPDKAGGRSSGKTFRTLLSEASANSRTSDLDIDSLLDSLLTINPTIQISVPELDAGTAESWNTDNEIPKVAIVDSEYDDRSSTTIKAFDLNGKIYQLDANNEPDELVVVIRPSESVVAYPRSSGTKGSNGRVLALIEPCLEPYLQTKTHTYYLMDDCGGGGGGGGGGTGGTTTCYRSDADGKYDYINKAKFLNKDKLRDVEDWALGKPDMYVIQATINIYDGYPAFNFWRIAVGKDGWYSTNIFGGIKDLQEKNIDKSTSLNWRKRLHGYQVYYYWLEKDVSVNMEARTFYVRSEFDSEDWASSGHINGYTSAYVYNGDDDAGYSIVNYRNNVCGEGTKYYTSHLYFYMNYQ